MSQRYWWGPLQKCHWPVNDKYTFQVKPGIILISGLLIGREHKIKPSYWLRGQSMKNQRMYPFIFSVHQYCHWPVNDSFKTALQNCHWLVNDTFLKSINLATYGHVSLTPVNYKKFMAICHWLWSMTKKLWTKLQKLSLTAVNDKKKCHWLDVYYIWRASLIKI